MTFLRKISTLKKYLIYAHQILLNQLRNSSCDSEYKNLKIDKNQASE